MISASKLGGFFIEGTYKINIINPSCFNCIVGKSTSMLYVHPEIEVENVKAAFSCLLSDLSNLANNFEILQKIPKTDNGPIHQLMELARSIQQHLGRF